MHLEIKVIFCRYWLIAIISENDFKTLKSTREVLNLFPGPVKSNIVSPIVLYAADWAWPLVTLFGEIPQV